MQIVIERAAGLDIHKQTVVAAIQTPESRSTRTFGTMTRELEQLAAWLLEQGITHVAMEATGVYWQPVYNVLEEHPFELLVVNAQHFKAVPGRKTDVKDAEWLADLLRHGLLRGSFIPERERRELVRYRKSLIRERASEINRIQKVLEGANIKLGSVASNILGVSGRQMLAAIIAGEEDPAVLADLARGKLQRKQAAREQALTGKLGAHQRYLLAEQLRHIDELEERIERLSAELADRLARVPADAEAVERLDSIPGVGPATAEVIVAEVGTDLSRFPTAKHLASWAGLCPGNRESAGKRQSGRTRKGNPWLREALVEAAEAAVRVKGTVFQALYQRLAARRGRKRAILAVAHRLLVVAYQLLQKGEAYREVGADAFDERQRVVTGRRLAKRLQTLGFRVPLEPVT